MVRLSDEERRSLEKMIRTGRDAGYRLLKADVAQEGGGWSDAQISQALETSPSTVSRTRRQLVEEGLEAALSRKTQSKPHARIFDGEAEAKLIALACAQPPEGHARWSLRLLEKRVVELGYTIERASNSTIGRMLKKTSLNSILDDIG